MKLKLTKDGHAVVKDGKPVYILDNGTELGVDGAAAMKLALNKHFEASPVMAALKIPHDVAAAFFGDAFRIEGGKLVAIDSHGIQMYSPTRHGEAANFDEAFGQLVERYHAKDKILKLDGEPSAAAPGQRAKGSAITRAQFDAMPQDTRARYLKEGGRIGDDADTGATRVSAAAPQAGVRAITRAEFDVMPNNDRAAHFKTGGKVVD